MADRMEHTLAVPANVLGLLAGMAKIEAMQNDATVITCYLRDNSNQCSESMDPSSPVGDGFITDLYVSYTEQGGRAPLSECEIVIEYSQDVAIA